MGNTPYFKEQGKKLPEYIDQYRDLIAAYHQDALLPIAAKLADKDASISTKTIEEMEEMMQQFMQNTETLHHFLKDHANKKDREYLSKVADAIDSFRTLQERNIYLLEAWETRQLILNNRRALN